MTRMTASTLRRVRAAEYRDGFQAGWRAALTALWSLRGLGATRTYQQLREHWQQLRSWAERDGSVAEPPPGFG